MSPRRNIFPFCLGWESVKFIFFLTIIPGSLSSAFWKKEPKISQFEILFLRKRKYCYQISWNHFVHKISLIRARNQLVNITLRQYYIKLCLFLYQTNGNIFVRLIDWGSHCFHIGLGAIFHCIYLFHANSESAKEVSVAEAATGLFWHFKSLI